MLEINIRRSREIAILDLSGSIDVDAANLVEIVGSCLDNGYKDMLCNFESVNLVDYTGLSLLAVANKDVINHKGRMKLLNVPAHIKKLLCMVCLDAVFELYDNEELAIKSFEEDRIISEIQKKRLRRRFKRLFLDIDLEFKPQGRKEEFYKGKVLNISAVGMLVFAENTCPLGEVLDVKLALLPQPGTLELTAKVVWLVRKDVQPQLYPGMGLEFYHIENQTQKKIVEFVERNLPLSCTTDGQ